MPEPLVATATLGRGGAAADDVEDDAVAAGDAYAVAKLPLRLA